MVQHPFDIEEVEATVQSAREVVLDAVGDPVASKNSKAVMEALNAASGKKYDREAAMAAIHMRGERKRPFGNWVSCSNVQLALLFDCCSTTVLQTGSESVLRRRAVSMHWDI
jgi:hypothetical protein